MVKTNKGNVMILILAAVVVVGVGYWYVTTKQTATSKPELTPTVTPTETTIDTSNWKTYTNEELGISFMYPANMKDISTLIEDKFFMQGEKQPENREVIDGLMVMVTTSNPKSGSLKDDLLEELNETFSDLDSNDFTGSYFKGKLLVTSTVGGYDDEVYRMVFEVDKKYVHVSFIMGQYDQGLYRQIRNSIIDSIEFVK